MSGLAVTWWGHSSTSVELGDRVVATDPLLTTNLFHLRRSPPAPPAEAARADLVLVSHLHHDHLHLPSLDRFDDDVPVVVPRGAPRVVRGLDRRPLLEVAPGEEVEVAGVRVQVLPAHHDGRRSNVSRPPVVVPAVGFRLERAGRSLWYPGDTGRLDFTGVGAVDLAAVPIGGWGPSLGDEHLDPAQAAAAVAEVGATWSLAVHYGTFWPMALRRVHPRNHRHFFITPPTRFHAAVADLGVATRPLTPLFGERQVLV
ncbi:MBL fold metallo-hydrolase [Nocardioides mangrovicus]|uniref:MBL fold metallo-hydrolase n=1 Tax=Nocardioides mangrovicus TaxID=2478913 RepID=A0A3L8P5L0_9ACTN|nr:MBL fold metallo-hydrolase [Nocardioides mangrovicus]RLV50670.1 MBL fold metallo-hydrolase [Nocardioides mangrovicus]